MKTGIDRRVVLVSTRNYVCPVCGKIMYNVLTKDDYIVLICNCPERKGKFFKVKLPCTIAEEITEEEIRGETKI